MRLSFFLHWRRGLGLMGMVLALAACAPAVPTLVVDDMRFDRSEVVVKAGAPVTLRVVNHDGFAHAFDIDAFDVHVPLPAGAAEDVVFTPAVPGRYRFYCGSPGHEAAGMVGELVVEP